MIAVRDVFGSSFELCKQAFVFLLKNFIVGLQIEKLLGNAGIFFLETFPDINKRNTVFPHVLERRSCLGKLGLQFDDAHLGLVDLDKSALQISRLL